MAYINKINVDGEEYEVQDENAVHDVDASLTKEGQAADAKAVGDALKQLPAPDGGGLSSEQINALDGMFKIAAYASNASNAYSAFKSAFGIADSGNANVSDETTWADGVPYTYTPIAGYVEKSDGSFVDYASWARTPYLYCEGASKLRVTEVLATSQMSGGSSGDYNAFYDKDKNFIKSFSFADIAYDTAGSFIDVDIPSNATYFVASGKTSVISNDNGYGQAYASFTPYA